MATSTRTRLHSVIVCLLALLLGAAPVQGQDGDPVLGEKLIKLYGCKECHTVQGEGGTGETRAPELAGLYRTTVEMEKRGAGRGDRGLPP